MTNKTEKEITLFSVKELVKLSKALDKRNETLDHIDYKDEFKFEKGSLNVHHSFLYIKGFMVILWEDNKTIRRYYVAKDNNPFSLDDFKISSETIYYED